LIVLGYDYGWIGLRRTEAGVRLIQAINQKSNEPGAVERIMADVSLPSADAPVYLRVTVAKDATCQFAYSFDNTAFTPLPSTFQATVDRWIGARVGLFSNGAVAATHGGYADFDWFHLTPP
jgi:beta-xylosidase